LCSSARPAITTADLTARRGSRSIKRAVRQAALLINCEPHGRSRRRATTRAYAKVVDEVNRIELKELQVGAR
jgi:hypothetical protein